MFFRTFLSLTALVLAAAGPRVGAMVLEGGQSAAQDQDIEARAFEAGKQHSCVVVVSLLRDGKCFGYGSGVYLGIGRDGKHGHILTAAHVALNAKFEAEKLKPGLEPQAILSFPLDDTVLGYLRAHRIVPPSLRANTSGLAGPMEGVLAGFGMFGTSIGESFQHLLKLHAGPALAHYSPGDDGADVVMAEA